MLAYPFGNRWSPEPGQPFEVADGVYWLRMPLPIELDHINLWLLDNGDDTWTIVDTGYEHDACKAVWEQVFERFLRPESVTQIIITHFHPDHIGLAAWLADRCNAPILISKGEFSYYREIVSQNADEFEQQVNRFAKQVGFDGEMTSALIRFFGVSNEPERKRVTQDMCAFLSEGDALTINNRQWQVVMGSGHSPEHACLYCADLDTLISGDQAIARISSNISVYPSKLLANPLKDWLSSCEKLRDKYTDKTLVLASHQEPFQGLVERMQFMIDEHQTDLDNLKRALTAKLNTAAVRQILFNRELNFVQSVLATGEALAHINYLKLTEELQVSYDEGVAYYQLSLE